MGIGNTALPFIQYDKLEDFRNEQIVVFNDSDRSVWEWIPKEYQHKGNWPISKLNYFFSYILKGYSGGEVNYLNGCLNLRQNYSAEWRQSIKIF